MLSKVIAAMVLTLAILTPSISVSETTVTITSEKVTGKNKDYCDGFPDDDLRLTIKRGKEVIEDTFCSSYGKADAFVVTDRKGGDFLLLRFGEGRGTNAVSEYLSVFRISKKLVEYARIPISSAAGFTSRWEYDYKIEKPYDGGLKIILDLDIIGADAEWYPNEKQRIVQIK